MSKSVRRVQLSVLGCLILLVAGCSLFRQPAAAKPENGSGLFSGKQAKNEEPAEPPKKEEISANDIFKGGKVKVKGNVTIVQAPTSNTANDSSTLNSSPQTNAGGQSNDKIKDQSKVKDRSKEKPEQNLKPEVITVTVPPWYMWPAIIGLVLLVLWQVFLIYRLKKL